MLFDFLSITAGIAFIAFLLRRRYQSYQNSKALVNARDGGVEVDAAGHIDAERTFVSMCQHEVDTGVEYTGKKARFMKLMRVVYEGPKSPEEIRFLFEEGIDPIVRPDGLIYVPCIENEHLSVEGELELKEQDLEHYIKQGHLEQVPIEARSALN